MHAIRDVSVVEAPLGIDDVAARVDRMLCSTTNSVCLAHGRIVIPMSKARIDEEFLLKNVEGARIDWGCVLFACRATQARCVYGPSVLGHTTFAAIEQTHLTGGLEGDFAGSLKAFVEEASQESYAPEDIWPRELAGVLQRVQPRFPPNVQQLEQVYELAERLDAVGSLNGWMGTLVRR